MQIWEAFGVHTGYRGPGTGGAAGPGHALHHLLFLFWRKLTRSKTGNPTHLTSPMIVVYF